MNKNNIYLSYYQSPVGKITIASDGENLIGLWIEGQTHFETKHKNELVQNDSIELFKTIKNWLDDYFFGNKPKITDLPIKLIGTDFEVAVWKLLCKIPYGSTTTYGDIAKQIAKHLGKEKMSAQAVGGAVGRNPISIIVPCHRVIGSNGKLVGYAGGLDLKHKLLIHEKVK